MIISRHRIRPKIQKEIIPDTNGRPRNNVRSLRFTRRSLEPVIEIIRPGVITRQMRHEMQMQRHLHRQQTDNIEHNSMMLQIRAGVVPANLRSTRNRRRRPEFTRSRPIVRPEPVPSTSQAPEISPTPETSHRPALRSDIAAPVPGTSRDAMPGPSNQSGNVPATGRTSTVTPQPNSHMATRSSSRFRSYQRPERRIVSPPHWRPDLVHESSSDDEDAINRQLEERRLSTYLAMRRVPLPVSIVRPHRATDPTIGDNGRILHMPGANMERNSSRNESQLPAWMRPRRDGSLRVEHEEDFVPAGYFPNLSREGTSRQHQGQGNVHPAGTNTMPTNDPTDDVGGTSRVSPLPQSSNDQHVGPNMPSAMTPEASTSTGRKYSRKNPSVGKSPRNLLKARDIPKELRENLRALAYNRRKSARLRGRCISNDESDEGDQTSENSAESSDECHTPGKESAQSASRESAQSSSNANIQSASREKVQSSGQESVKFNREENGSGQHGQDNAQQVETNTTPINMPADDTCGKSSVSPLPQSSNDQHVRSNNMPPAMLAEASTSTGRKFSRKNPSVGKSPRNLLKARDIPKELRENLRALAYNRRKSARLRGRCISSDESDEGDQTSENPAESSDECPTSSKESSQSASRKNVQSSGRESVNAIREDSGRGQHVQDNAQQAETNTMPTNMPGDDAGGKSSVSPLPQSSNDQHERSNNMPSALTTEASTSTGRKYSRKNPSVGKSPRNLLKARDIPKELRENLRALAYNRRRSARLRGRCISNDESDEGNQTSGSSAESSDERHTTSSESLQSSCSLSSEPSQKSVESASNESVQSIRQKNAQTTGSKSVHSASKESVQSASRENAQSTSRGSVN